MDGTITFSKGVVYYTTDKTGSDEFVFHCLEKFREAAPRDVKIVREPGEKPRLEPRAAEFSLTHTKGFLAAAFSDAPVGIDAENLRRFRIEKAKDRGSERLRRNKSEETDDPGSENLRRFRIEKAKDRGSKRLRLNQSEETDDPGSENLRRFRNEEADDPAALARCRAVAKRFFGAEVASIEEFFRLWTKKEAIAKRDAVPLLERRADGAIEYFHVGDFLIAVAVK